MTTGPRSPARLALRGATAPLHARVDALFADGLRSARDYRVYLRGMQAPAAFAWQAWNHPQRLAWLDADLAALGLAPLPPGPGLRVHCAGAAAGALYVLEGSMLGARTLLDDVRTLGWSAQRGAAFLHGHAGDDAGARWRTFTRHLEQADFGVDETDAMLAAAAAAFASVEHDFRRAGSLEPENA